MLEPTFTHRITVGQVRRWLELESSDPLEEAKRTVERGLATVYVTLRDEGVDVWRPVQAEHAGGDLYRLTGEPPDDEVLAFAVGDVVHCQLRTLSGDGVRGEPVLVAYERATRQGSRAALARFTKPRRVCSCAEGWICWKHPAKGWSHASSEESAMCRAGCRTAAVEQWA
jgi:hypothetical protein